MSAPRQPATDPGGDPATDRRRAAAWLRRWNLGGVRLTPLTTARIVIRLRADRIAWGALALWVVVNVAIIVWRRAARGENGSDAAGLAALASLLVVWLVGTLVSVGYQRAKERRLEVLLATRVAHPAARGVVRVIGAGRLTAAIVCYATGLVLGVATSVLVSDTSARILAREFTGALAALGVLAVVLVRSALRRPAIADDDPSLAADDVLRSNDARNAAAPIPILLSVVVAVSAAAGPELARLYAGHAALSALAYLAAVRYDGRRRS